MKEKHIRQRVESCLSLSRLSPCTRRQFGAVILDPVHNCVVADGYNGPLRGGCGDLCADKTCAREGITSGSQLEIGCVHAEQNAIYNAARRGASVEGCWIFVNGEPCLICAKAIVQVGIKKVICIANVYDGAGVELLKNSGVLVQLIQDY